METLLDLAADTLTWSAAVSVRRPPRWATTNTVVQEWPLARLRDFSGLADGSADQMSAQVATLVLPPQAGHDSCIVDYAPEQSQIRTAQEAGLRRVFAMDWKGATARTRNASVEDYIQVLGEAVHRLGGRVNLVGDCQGGWLAVIYAALHPATVASLTIAGAPVDFHAGEPVIGDWLRRLSPRGELRLFRAVVAANGGILPGRFLLTGFKAMQPGAGYQRRVSLLPQMRDPLAVERHRRFEDWFEHTQPIAGAFYLWIVEHLFLQNELVQGRLRVGGRLVDLAQLDMPVNLLGGSSDHITPPAQVFALAEHIATPADDVVHHTVPGGHLGLFMGHQALNDYWRPVFAGMAADG